MLNEPTKREARLSVSERKRLWACPSVWPDAERDSSRRQMSAIDRTSSAWRTPALGTMSVAGLRVSRVVVNLSRGWRAAGKTRESFSRFSRPGNGKELSSVFIQRRNWASRLTLELALSKHRDPEAELAELGDVRAELLLLFLDGVGALGVGCVERIVQ